MEKKVRWKWFEKKKKTNLSKSILQTIKATEKKCSKDKNMCKIQVEFISRETKQQQQKNYENGMSKILMQPKHK